MLEVSQINKRYGKRTVVRDASFTLSPGECLGIAGHNGSGKSTLMAIVAGVMDADSGAITCGGKSVMGDRAFLRASMGYVPQQNSLLADLTVEETLRFWQQTYGLGHLDLFADNSPCTMLGLGPLAQKRVGTLSGGMQKRVSAAIALLHNPRFLLMDEVLPAMDRGYRARLYTWLGGMRQNGSAILYCSHEVEELKSFCDNILVLRDGQTVFYGPAAQFPTQPQQLDSILNSAQPTP